MKLFKLFILMLIPVALFAKKGDKTDFDLPLRIAVLPITFEDDGYGTVGFLESEDDAYYAYSDAMVSDAVLSPLPSLFGHYWSEPGMMFYSRREGNTPMVWQRPDNPPDRITSQSSEDVLYNSNDEDDDSSSSETDSLYEMPEDNSYGIGTKTLTTHLITELVDESDAFDVISRDSFEEIFSEFELQASGIISTEDLYGLGEALTVDYLLKTEITALDGEELAIYAQLVSVDTAKIVLSDSVSVLAALGVRGLREALTDMSDRLARKARGEDVDDHVMITKVDGVTIDTSKPDRTSTTTMSSRNTDDTAVDAYYNGLEAGYKGMLLFNGGTGLLNGGSIKYRFPGESEFKFDIAVEGDVLYGTYNIDTALLMINGGVGFNYNLIQNGHMNLGIGADYCFSYGLLSSLKEFNHNDDIYSFSQHSVVGTLQIGLHLSDAMLLRINGQFMLPALILAGSESPDLTADQMFAVDEINQNGIMGIMWSAELSFLF